MKATDFKKKAIGRSITLLISEEALGILDRLKKEQNISKSQIVDQLIKSITFD